MKSYKQFCSVARALDAIGDRWALLVVRELLLGPRRYTDLLSGLPGVGTNVLSTRLRELEAAGIVRRGQLPAPTAVAVYELTDDGLALRPVVDSLARWGTRRLTSPTSTDVVQPRWLVTSLAAALDPGMFDGGSTVGVRIDGDAFALTWHQGDLSVTHGEAERSAATLRGSMAAFFETAKGRGRRPRIEVDGDPKVGRQVLDAIAGCMR